MPDVIVVIMTAEKQGDYDGTFCWCRRRLRSSSLCIIDEQGKVCLEHPVSSAIDETAAAIRGFAAAVDGVALETGNLTPWLTAGLRAEGFRVVVVEAGQVQTTLSSLRTTPTGTMRAV